MADLNELDDATLEAMLKNSVNPQAPDEEEPTEAPAREPEPETAEPEPPAEAPPAAEPATRAPEPEQDFERARLQAVIDELEARQKAMDSKMGRFAGEADFWRRKAEAKRPEPAPVPETYEAEPQVSEPRAPAPPARDGLLKWAVSQAIQGGEAQFEAEHPESKDMKAEILDYVRKSGYDGVRLVESDDPLAAQREAYRVLDEAFWNVKAAKAAQMRADIEQKRTEQFARQKEAKQRASVTGSGTTAAPKPPPKTLNDMTDGELEAELKRLSRG